MKTEPTLVAEWPIFYVNYTLRGPAQQAVAAVLAGRASIVSPLQNGCVVLFDEESEEQNQEVIAELASRLSGRLKCPLLVVVNHDDDILKYQLFLNGDLMDEYDSTPGYFRGDEEEDDESSPLKDTSSLQAWFDSNALEIFEDNVRRGIWVRMSDYEVAVAKRA